MDGELALSAGQEEAWRGRLSSTALDRAEEVWATRSFANRLTDGEAATVLRAAVDCDAAFYGLVTLWDDAQVEVDGPICRVLARVRSLPEPLVGPAERCASIVLELVDMHPCHAVRQVEDAAGALLEDKELRVWDLDGPDVETLWGQAHSLWSTMAARSGLAKISGSEHAGQGHPRR